jgi:Sec-independent protein translocase protein TatA
MEIFNIGPFELALILLLAFIVLGPDGMVSFARKSAKWISKIVRSPMWKDFINTSEEVRSIPKQLLKEANLAESLKEIKDLSRQPFVLPANRDFPQQVEATLGEEKTIGENEKTENGENKPK